MNGPQKNDGARAGLTSMPIMPWHGAPVQGAPLGGTNFFNIQISINISKCWAMHQYWKVSALPLPQGVGVAGPGLGPISGLQRPLSLLSITCRPICRLHDLQTCKSCRFISTCGVPYFYFFVTVHIQIQAPFAREGPKGAFSSEIKKLHKLTRNILHSEP